MKPNKYTMAEQIKTLQKTTDEIKKSLTSYMAEDRLWKDGLCSNLDKRYANKNELTHLKVLVYGIIAVLAGVASLFFPFFLE